MKRLLHQSWQPNVYVVDPWVTKLTFGAPVSVVVEEVKIRMEVAFDTTKLLFRLIRS